jgi:tRNA threonylcarbamoyladenosine biosynthesis protein TsaE
MNISGKIFLSGSPQATRKIGEEIAKKLRSGSLVFLTGELGSGKTTLVQGIAKALGVREKVRSPSFLIVNEYSAKGGAKLYHMDLYRLAPADIDNFGLEDYLFGRGICVVEWAEKLNRRLNAGLEIKLKWLSERERSISIHENTGN